jgi:dihydrofolate synthase/folylpolyglutamate synthase
MPTFFELNTAVAFRLFEEACVDVAIVEVGMGGRFDSTNVIQPVATAITTIGLEHTAYLGDTLEKIAFEKAGIIKPETPVVIGDIASGPRSVITTRAADVGAPVHLFGTDFSVAVEGHPWEQRIQFNAGDWRLSNASLALAGRYQAANAAVAIELARTLVPRFPRLDKRAIVAGLANARWPCRMHQVLDHPRVIIDVAHNVAGIERLADSIDKAVVLLAVAEDKDAHGMLRALDPIADRLILSRFTGSRGRAPETLAALMDRTDFDLCASLEEALQLGLRYAERGLPLLITGSIFTAGEAHRLLQQNDGVPPLRF